MDTEGPIVCILVVGFHHKKGCQLEYSYPALVENCPNECPPGWKYLPTLVLPDGSHNYDEDTIFFHLPSLRKPIRTVFGVSCYRQIPVENTLMKLETLNIQKIKNRTPDMTRATIQKSVCILSRIPVYGQIQVKLSLITQTYFDVGDFSQISILQDAFHHISDALQQEDFSPQLFVGLSAKDLIRHWKHKVLLLFKLLLLERKVIFYKSPVHLLTSTILTLTSLFPDMIEKGLNSSAWLRLSRPISPMPQFSDDDTSQHSTPIKSNTEQLGNINGVSKWSRISEYCDNGGDSDSEPLKAVDVGVDLLHDEEENSSSSSQRDNLGQQKDHNSQEIHRNFNYLATLNGHSCGFPLEIFTKGYLNLPYLSLSYLDLLSDVNVRGYILGATNVLFKQKSQLYDVLVDAEMTRIECLDPELRRQLHLTTEDLRFADYIVKHVMDEKLDVFVEGIGWEGGDDWIRAQFHSYLVCLLRTSLTCDDDKESEPFNSSFMNAWRSTHNYKIWSSGDHSGITDVSIGHPFAGQLSVADMKLRLTHTMQSTDGGRKLNQAVLNTGKAVATTSKTVGNALSQAKGAISTWWSNLLISPEASEKIIQSEQSILIDNDENCVDSVDGNGLPSQIYDV